MSFEDYASICSRTFAQTPIRLVRMSSSLRFFAGCTEPPYRHLVLLCQPYFSSTSITIVFYLNGTAYFEYLNEESIRQRLKLLNNPRRNSYHRQPLIATMPRIQSLFGPETLKNENPENELHAKLLSPRLLSIELVQDDLKFKFRCEERPALFEQHYVRQLLVQVKELSRRQAYLCELLEHKDELPQFDSQLFLSTPMTLVDDPDEEEEDAEILSTSATGRLWKAAFNRRGGQKFLDICLLKKAYMKALEAVVQEEEDKETISTLLTTMVDQTISLIQQEKSDEIPFAQRLTKRSLATSVSLRQDQDKQLKRLRAESLSSFA